jgi:hypothetical protein
MADTEVDSPLARIEKALRLGTRFRRDDVAELVTELKRHRAADLAHDDIDAMTLDQLVDEVIGRTRPFGPLAPLVAARKALGDLVHSPRYTLTLTADHRKAEDQLLAEAIRLADAAIEKESRA